MMDGEKLVGMISERDYARKIILLGRASKNTLVREIMTEKVTTVHPNQTVWECMSLMTDRHIRHLPVVIDEKVIGVVSIGDVVNNTIHQQKKSIRDLEKRILSEKSG